MHRQSSAVERVLHRQAQLLARVLGDKGNGPLSFRRLMVSLGLVMLPALLVFVEPDLGTSMSFVMIWATMARGL